MITRRHSFAIVPLLPVFLLAASLAQTSKPSKGPRAVGVLEPTPQGLRLVPVSLVIEGKFYDAGLYRANPVPFALDMGNVYIVQKGGDPIGDFTVTDPAQIAGGAWIGQGKWVSNEDRQKQEEARARESSTPAKAPEEKDEPPVLRRGGKPAASATSAPATSSAPAIKEKAPEPAPAPTQKSSDDSDRPVLKRGKPEVEQASKLGNEKTLTATTTKTPPGLSKVQVAVSDASTDESRPYTWKWTNAEEEQKMGAQIERLAIAAVAAYVSKNGGPKPGKLEDVEIHAFDLNYNNAPDVILSARVSPAPASAPVRKAGSKAVPSSPVPASNGFEYYVTVVARDDIYATLQKSFAEVTDSKHLDAYPRLQLIDAVDADGNGAGDLLFRRISDLSTSFVLYRVYASRLDELLRVPEPKL